MMSKLIKKIGLL